MLRNNDDEQTYQTQPHDHANPEQHIVGGLVGADPAGALQHDDGELHHLADEAVAAQLLRDAGHDDLVADGGDEERDDGGEAAADARRRRRVHVAPQEAVDGHVPLAAELHPVRAVPPVAVEVAVREPRELRARPEHVLEDDEEHEQERQHEGEEQPRDGLGEDQQALGPRGDELEPHLRLLEHRQDELLRDDGQEEDAAEDGQDLGEQVRQVDGRRARVLELVAERRAEEVVDVVGPG